MTHEAKNWMMNKNTRRKIMQQKWNFGGVVVSKERTESITKKLGKDWKDALRILNKKR